MEFTGEITGELAPRTQLVAANGLRFEVDMFGGGQRPALCPHGFEPRLVTAEIRPEAD